MRIVNKKKHKKQKYRITLKTARCNNKKKLKS